MKMITFDGKIHMGEPTNDIVVPPELFRQVLTVFKHITIQEFKFNNDTCYIKFANPIYLLNYKHQIETPAFTSLLDINLTPDELTITTKESIEKAKAAKKEAEEAKQKEEVKIKTESFKETKEALEEEIKKENEESSDKKPLKEDVYGVLPNDEIKFKELNVGKKLTKVPAGVYKINFDESKYTWVLVYSNNNKRLPVKTSGEFVVIPKGAKTITPINNKGK